MNEALIRKLSSDTCNLIKSTQVITSVSTAVKELVENSLDAGAKNIEVRLVNYGLILIEIKDDGHGIKYVDVSKVALQGFTSKLDDFSSLSAVETYGFRGEALSSLCKISQVTITTKADGESLAMTYDLDNEGRVLRSKPSHIPKGTIISIHNIFYNVPVRKQFVGNGRKPAEELKKVEFVVKCLAVINPDVRICIKHNKCQIWQKNSVADLRPSFMQAVGLKVVSKMVHLKANENETAIEVIVPKKDLQDTEHVFVSIADMMYIFINKRHVQEKQIRKVVMKHISLHFKHLDLASKTCVSLISITIPPNETDINLEPNKTKILIKNKKQLLDLIENTLANYYEHELNLEQYDTEDHSKQEDECPRKRRKFDSTFGDISLEMEENENTRSTQDIVKLVKEKNNLCSQINSENNVLSQLEVSQLNNIIERNNSLVKQLSRTTPDNDLQSLVNSLGRSESESLMEEISSEFENYGMETLDEVMVEETCANRSGNAELNVTEFERSKDIFENSDRDLITSGSILQSKALNVLDREIKDNSEVSILDDLIFGTREPQRDPSTGATSIVEPLGADALASVVRGDISEATWSKGHLKNINGEYIQGGAMLLPRSEEPNQLNLSVQSVSSQMGKKEFSGFTKFARQIRPKIVEENPGILFTKVSDLLAERWQQLSPEEQQQYSELAKEVDEKRMQKRDIKYIQNNQTKKPGKTRTIQPKQNSALKTFLEKVKKPPRPVRREIIINVALEKIRSAKLLQESNEGLKVIGQVQPDGHWLYCDKNNIGHIRHSGLQELIIFHRMMNNHEILTSPTGRIIHLNKSTFEGMDHLWDLLFSLETESDVNGNEFIMSDVIVKNGFKIKVARGCENYVVITELATVITSYGVNDLKETLQLYQLHGEYAGMAKWRNTAVVTYLKNEAIRLTSQSGTSPTKEVLEELIETWSLGLKHLPAECLHSRPIFPTIHQLTS